MGLAIRLLQVYSPWLANDTTSLRLWDSISQAVNAATETQLPKDYQNFLNMLFLAIKNQNWKSL